VWNDGTKKKPRRADPNRFSRLPTTPVPRDWPRTDGTRRRRFEWCEKPKQRRKKQKQKKLLENSCTRTTPDTVSGARRHTLGDVRSAKRNFVINYRPRHNNLRSSLPCRYFTRTSGTKKSH